MILVSECLTGVPCRMDGKAKLVPEIKRLVDAGEAIAVCPEVLGGLPTPREPSELRGGRAVTRSGADVTDAFLKGARESLQICLEQGCTLAVLKSKSPSCGYGQIHDGTFGGGLVPGNGIFAQMLIEAGIPVMTETDYVPGAEHGDVPADQ